MTLQITNANSNTVERQLRESRNILTKLGHCALLNATVVAENCSANYWTVKWTAAYDENGWYDSATYKYTPKTPGIYAIDTMVDIDNANASEVQSKLYAFKNTTGFFLDQIYVGAATDLPAKFSLHGSCLVQCDGVSDYITIQLYNPAADLKAPVGGYFHIHYVGYKKP